MWPFTGHCRYSYDCDRWENGCGKCPNNNIYPPIRFDGTRLQWNIKRWLYRRSNITFIAPSKWIYKLAQKSMINPFPIHHIPHGVDTNVFRKLETSNYRAKLKLPDDKKIILFVAHQIDKYVKGCDLLIRALKKIPQKLRDESILLTMGRHNAENFKGIDMQTVNLGYVYSDREKAFVYNVADLFICPSRAENFANVLLESMACGTPVVAFDVGGISETVRPEFTGFLAKPENTEELASGIVEYLENDKLRETASKTYRKIVLKEYTIELMVKRYKELFRQVIAKNEY
jgi:glycosyltransferase involved in cell wall biosynthesis